MGVFRLYTVGSPYAEEHLFNIDVEQSADTLYLAHLDVTPYKLVRADHDDWTFSVVDFQPGIDSPTNLVVTVDDANQDSSNAGDDNAFNPREDRYVVSAVIDEESRPSPISTGTNDLSLARNENSLSWTAVAGAERYNVYKAHEEGQFGFIGSSTTNAFTDDNIGPDYSRGPRVAFTPFDTTDNYPSTVTFYEQRSVWARSRNNPNAIWFSRSGSFENLDESFPLVANDSITLGLVAGQVNAVNQLASLDTVLALSSDAIFRIDSDDGNALSALNARSRRQLGRGSSRLFPLIIDNQVFYQPSIGAYVHSAGYNFQQDGYSTTNVAIYSPHFFDGHIIVDWAYVGEPHSLVWAVRDDGKLLCFAWEQEQQVWGWTLCETDGLVESVCAIPESGEDRLYLIVKRNVRGADRRFVERMASMAEPALVDGCFTDSSVSTELSEAGRVFGGLKHLEGETVDGIVDGKPVQGLVVKNGEVTVPEIMAEATKGTFGLPYETTIETLPVIFSSRENGWSVDRRKSIGRIIAKVRNSGVFDMGVRASSLTGEPTVYPVKSRSTEAHGSPDDYLNGDFEAATEPYISGEAVARLEQNRPLPLNLLAVFMDPNVSD